MMKTITIYRNQSVCTLAAGLWLLAFSVAAPEEINATYKGGRPTGMRIIQWLETR